MTQLDEKWLKGMHIDTEGVAKDMDDLNRISIQRIRSEYEERAAATRQLFQVKLIAASHQIESAHDALCRRDKQINYMWLGILFLGGCVAALLYAGAPRG